MHKIRLYTSGRNDVSGIKSTVYFKLLVLNEHCNCMRWHECRGMHKIRLHTSFSSVLYFDCIYANQVYYVPLNYYKNLYIYIYY